jgi:hypothetical protein
MGNVEWIGWPRQLSQKKLAALQRLESELVRKAARIIQQAPGLSNCDFFVMGAARRTLAQAAGFCALVQMKNFSACLTRRRTASVLSQGDETKFLP